MLSSQTDLSLNLKLCYLFGCLTLEKLVFSLTFNFLIYRMKIIRIQWIKCLTNQTQKYTINGNRYYGFVFSSRWHYVGSSSFPNKDPIYFQILHSLSLILKGNCPIGQAPDYETAVKTTVAIPVKRNSCCPFRCPIYTEIAGIVKFKKTTLMGGKSQVGRNASNCFISYCFKEAILFWQSRAKSEVLSIVPYTLEVAPHSGPPHHPMSADIAYLH